MRRSDFWLIVITGIISGVLLLAGGIFAATYYTEISSYPANVIYAMGPIQVFPYAAYSGSLLGGGAVSLFIGIAYVFLATQKETSVKPTPLPTEPKQPSST
jgi:hypothetical protein